LRAIALFVLICCAASQALAGGVTPLPYQTPSDGMVLWDNYGAPIYGGVNIKAYVDAADSTESMNRLSVTFGADSLWHASAPRDYWYNFYDRTDGIYLGKRFLHGIHVGYGAVDDSSIADETITSRALSAGAIGDSLRLASDVVGWSKLTAGVRNTISGKGVGDVTGVSQGLGMSITSAGGPVPGIAFRQSWGDSTYVNEGQSGSVTSGMLASGAVSDSGKVASGAISVTRLNLTQLDTRYVNEGQSSSVTSAMLGTGAVSDSLKIAAGAVKITRLDLTQADARWLNEGQATSVTSAMLASGAVGDSLKMASGVVSVTRLNTTQTDARYVNEGQANGVTSGMIAAGAVADSSKLGTGAVTITKLNTTQLDARYINEGQSESIDICCSAGGIPSAAEVLLRIPMTRTVILPASLTGSQGVVGTAGTVSASGFSIKKNGTECATLSFASTATTCTFTNTVADTFVAGDVLTIIAPSPANATLSDVGITLKATR
jgi:hypothetical protein